MQNADNAEHARLNPAARAVSEQVACPATDTRQLADTLSVADCGYRQYFPWKTEWLISGQNSFKTLNAPSNAIWVSHFWPVFVQVRSREG